MKQKRIPPVLILAGMAGITVSCKQQPPVKPVNIIFIMSDDHAFQAISAYGSVLNQTPNIDRLAAEGMIFRNSFVTNSISAPSRAVILTGQFSHLNGVVDNAEVFDSSRVTFPKLLHAAGYQTAMIGKWHLKSQPSGFDYWKVLPGQGDYYQPEFLTPGGRVQEEGYVTDLIAEFALDWLKEGRDPGKPFLLMVHNKAPHREWWPGPEHLETYKNKVFPEPPTLIDDYSGMGRAAKEQEMTIRDHMTLEGDLKLKPEDLDSIRPEDPWPVKNFIRSYNRMNGEQKEAWDRVYDPIQEAFEQDPPQGDDLLRWKYQRYMEDYLACIASVDDNVGRLLEYLDKSGLAENTLVVYTSDQGFYLGEHGWFDKRFMYEPSFRTPLLMRWPGHIRPGSACTALVQNVDLAETFLDIAGVSIPDEMQGESLVPLMEGHKPPDWRKALYYQYFEYPAVHMVKRHYGIRTDRYKLIHFYYDIDEWELYDLQTDSLETHNLINNTEYQPLIDSLKEELGRLRGKYMDNDSIDQAFIRRSLER